jgi:thiol:disulfide interchange protein DsbC
MTLLQSRFPAACGNRNSRSVSKDASVKESLMAKIFIRFGAVLLASMLLVTPLVAADDVDERLAQVREKVSGMFAEIEPQHVTASPIDGWYMIRKGAVIAYISADGRFLLQGDLIDLDHQINLSEQSRDEARREMMSEVPREQMIIFSPEEVKYSINVFTDVDCTYCRRLHSQINEYLAEGIEVRYLLYPRNGPRSKSWITAEQVWCSDNRNEALTLAKLDQKFQTRECDASMVSRHYLMGQDVGLRGTPAIVFENGELVSGYVPPKELSEQLAAAAK